MQGYLSLVQEVLARKRHRNGSGISFLLQYKVEEQQHFAWKKHTLFFGHLVCVCSKYTPWTKTSLCTNWTKTNPGTEKNNSMNTPPPATMPVPVLRTLKFKHLTIKATNYSLIQSIEVDGVLLHVDNWIWWNIASYLPPKQLVYLGACCKALEFLCADDRLWSPFLHQLRPPEWEDPFAVAPSLTKDWKLCTTGKCRTRYL